jgi:hypothetical protein
MISFHRPTHSGGGGGTSCTPSKDFKKFGYQNAIKHEKRRPLYFITTPKTPSKEFENDCVSMSLL